MGGLLLAFLLRAYSAGSADEILLEGVAAGCRSVVWFAAFALFWSIPWSGRTVVLALAAGVTACLLNLSVSGGISFPSVAGPLWVLVGLALAAVTAAAPGWPLRRGLPLFLPLPVLAGVGLTYLMLVFVPVTSCEYELKQARTGQALFREKAPKREAAREAVAMMRYATDHLQEARKDDPTSVTPLAGLAAWSLELAPLRRAGDSTEALKFLDEAKKLDPLGKQVRLLIFQARLYELPNPEKGRPARLRAAAEALDGVLAVDPSEGARLHSRLAEACFRVGATQAGYREALLAWQEDEAAPGPAYRLTDRQRNLVARSLAFRYAFEAGSVLACAPQGPLHVLLAPGLKPEPPEERPAPAPSR
jgi:hypothetical protein